MEKQTLLVINPGRSFSHRVYNVFNSFISSTMFIENICMHTAILLKKYSLTNSFLTWPLTKANDTTFNYIHQNTFYQKIKVLAKICFILAM